MLNWFRAYVEAFNRGDFPGFGAYYADGILFHGQAATLAGRQAVLDFYRDVRARLDETLELLSFAAAPDGSRIQAEIRTTLVARADWPAMPTGPMKAGDRRQSVNFIRYDIADPETAAARFVRIRSARFSPLRPR